MKVRRESPVRDMVKDQQLDRAIAERFKAERHPKATVDGDDSRWDRDFFEEPGDTWESIDFMGGAN